MRNVLIGLLLALFGAGTALAQEICNNGIDDDNDGLVDAFDAQDCPCGPVACGNSFYNVCAPNCSAPIPPFPINPVQEWAYSGVSPNYIPEVADIDGDCVPEVIVAQSGGTIRVLNSSTGALLYSFVIAQFNYSSFCVGNVDADPEAEIFVVGNTGGAWRLVRIDYNAGALVQTFASTTPVTNPRFGPSLADFNQDGQPEVYNGNQIWNSQTGLLLADGGANNRGWFPIGTSNFMVATSIAADALPTAQCADCAGLELVAGNQVYSVDLASMTNAALNSMTVEVTGPGQDGATRLADFDRDGDLDAIVTNQPTATTGPVRIFIWDIQTPTQLGVTYSPPIGSAPRIGPATVADVDNDGWPEIVVCTQLRLSVLHDYQTGGGATWGSSAASTQAATLNTTDGSGATGITAYDFNGDGAFEILYRDQTVFRIFDGGLNTLSTFGCTSGTATEYPVVADCDGDGETEILISCGTDLRVYHSNTTPWVQARHVWNQFNYFVTNVNDDYTIPQQQQNHHIVGDSVMLNNFLVQAAVVDTNGIPLLPLPDATARILDYNCTPALMNVSVEICNPGDQILPANTPLTFYAADPTAVATAAITTVNTPIALNPGACDTVTFPVTMTSGPIFVVVNDDATLATPYNLGTQFPVTTIPECDYLNNIHDTIVVCSGCVLNVDSTWNNPCNGDMLGAVFLSSMNGTAPITYSIDGITYGAASSFMNLAAGNYTAYLLDNVGCGDTVTFTITDPPVLTIAQDSVAMVQCNGAADGYISVIGGGGTAPYQYQINGGPLQASPIFNPVGPGLNTVTIQDANNCTASLNFVITQPPPLGLNTIATANPTCAGLPGGTIFVNGTGGTLPYSYTVDNVNY
ncbi:MAG: FG-GAP-like repeat-containing protein, partial [Bacteroidota bacterium]